MDTMKAMFTKRDFNPVSIAVRMATPVSIVKMSPASHSIMVDGRTGYGLEANMIHGVRRKPMEELLHGLRVVGEIDYEVPCAEDGLAWMRDTADRNAPYDWKGAFGLGLAPDRNWQEDTDWFCFEYLANGLCKAGRRLFIDNAHVSGSMLMSIIPTYK